MNAPRVGLGEIGAGDQRPNGFRAALMGAQIGAELFVSLPAFPREPGAWNRNPRLAESARRRPLAIAVSTADDGRTDGLFQGLTSS